MRSGSDQNVNFDSLSLSLCFVCMSGPVQVEQLKGLTKVKEDDQNEPQVGVKGLNSHLQKEEGGC